MASIQLNKSLMRRLGDRLISDEVITPDQLADALERQRQTGEFLGESVVALGFASSSRVGKHLEELTGFHFVDLSEHNIEPELARAITEAMARNRKAIPFREEG